MTKLAKTLTRKSSYNGFKSSHQRSLPLICKAST